MSFINLHISRHSLANAEVNNFTKWQEPQGRYKHIYQKLSLNLWSTKFCIDHFKSFWTKGVIDWIEYLCCNMLDVCKTFGFVHLEKNGMNFFLLCAATASCDLSTNLNFKNKIEIYKSKITTKHNLLQTKDYFFIPQVLKISQSIFIRLTIK